MSELENKIAKHLSEFQLILQQEVKKQLSKMRTDINHQMEETAAKIETASLWLDEAKGRIEEVESVGTDIKPAARDSARINIKDLYVRF